MIITGIILMYPMWVTSFLPGQFVAAARVAHGNEAMLAVITIAVWHLYDVIFKPSVFPADVSIFTGKISHHRMKEEHGLEYSEIMAKKGRQDDQPVSTTPAGSIPDIGASQEE